MGTLKLNLVK